MKQPVTVTWSGDIDLYNAPELRSEIDAAIAQEPSSLTMDLGEVRFIDSMGLSLLMLAREHCMDLGSALVLRNVTPQLLRLLDITGVSSLFAFEESVTGVVGDRLDTLPEQTPVGAEPDAKFDRIAAMTRRILRVPTALVSLVDVEAQVFPGAVGLPEPWQQLRSTPLSHSFCKYVVSGAKPLIVHDARQYPMLADSLAIAELDVVAYAGMPLVDLDGVIVGSLCVIDSQPRQWTDDEVALLRDLAEVCSSELQVRTAIHREALSGERNRMAQTLQEQVVGDLLTLAMDLAKARASKGDVAEHLDAAIEKVNGILVGVRNAVFTR